jgi:hypothetical protein
VGLEGSYLISDWRTTLRLGTSYDRYESEGRDWERNGSHTWLGVVQGLPWDFVLELTGSFYWHPYDHRSSYDLPRYLFGTGPERRDQIFDANAELRYPVTEWLELSVHGRYIDDESNVSTFDFDRWIAGGKVTLAWNSTRD